MELEQFIEKDIMAFLDEKMRSREALINNSTAPIISPEEAGLYMPSKNYDSEMEQAIRDVNQKKAEQLLNDLKNEHDSFPENSPEQLERQMILERLYKRFKQAFGMGETPSEKLVPEQVSETPTTGFSSHKKTIESRSPSLRTRATKIPETMPAGSQERVGFLHQEEQEKQGVEKQKNKLVVKQKETLREPVNEEQKGVDKEKGEESKNFALSENTEKFEKRGEFRSSFYATVKHIRTLISEQLFTLAIEQYRDLKLRLVGAEELSSEERSELFKELKNVYEEIENRLGSSTQKYQRFEESGLGGVANGDDGVNDDGKDFEEALEIAETALGGGKIAEAMRRFNQAKKICKTISGKERLSLLYQRIKDAAQREESKLLDDEEKSLAGTP